MSYVDEVFTGIARSITEKPSAIAAKVATTANSSDDEVYVTVNNPEGTEPRLGPVQWRPGIDDAGDVTYPVRGDRCAVIFTNEGEPWILW